MTRYKISKFPKSRIATLDVCEIGRKKHHVTGLIEVDVTASRKKIRDYNKNHTSKISFTSWLLSVISITIKKHETVSAYLKGKNKLLIFEDINISIIIEKSIDGHKVPIPLIIEKAQEKSVEEIFDLINEAKNSTFSNEDIVLQKKANIYEKMYYNLPGFLRRYVWQVLLNHRKISNKKMGNVAITSLGMVGQIKGWFIPISVHPICFGLGSIIKKPIVVDDKIVVRDMLSISILIDHDVVDGAPMARFINDLVKRIENGD